MAMAVVRVCDADVGRDGENVGKRNFGRKVRKDLTALEVVEDVASETEERVG